MRLDVIAGRFTRCDPIAGGRTGTVRRARDLNQGRSCAAKVLRQRAAVIGLSPPLLLAEAAGT